MPATKIICGQRAASRKWRVQVPAQVLQALRRMPAPLHYSRAKSFISTRCDAATPPSPAAADSKRTDTRRPPLTVPQIFHVAVRPQPHVVGQVPADVIGVVINHNLVGIPQPVTAKAQIIWRDAEVKAAEPESRRTSSSQMPDVMRAKSAGEVPVLPRMIEMIVRIVLPGIVPDPLAIWMNVRSIRMPFLIHIGMIFFDGMPSALHRSGCMSWRVRGGTHTTRMTLRKNRNAAQQQPCQKSSKMLHVHLRR
jgi:hypothetical protein